MTYSFIDIAVYIVRRWWKMLIVLACFGAAGIALAFLLPKKYKSEIKLLPTTQETGIMGALSSLQSQFGLSGLSIPGGEGSEMLYYGEILRSNTVIDMVIDSCDLIDRMELSGRSEARSIVAGMIAFKHFMPENVFVIEVNSRDPQISADVANWHAKALDHYLTTSANTRGRHMREFVEARLSQAEIDIKIAEDSLVTFQKKHKLPPISSETGGELQAYAELKAQAVQKELELDYMRAFSSTNNPQYDVTRRELALLQGKLASLPEVASKYIRLYRNYIVHQEVYMLLVQQYEQAKLQEARDTPFISVLEWVKPSGEPYFPPKKLVVIVMLLVGLVVIVGYSMIAVYWQHVVSNPSDHKKMATLRDEFKRSSKRKR